MIRKLDRKGFTIVELLAVLVILIAIMAIAIPTISSSLERTKNKQNEARYKMIESVAELYVADNKNSVYNVLNSGYAGCWIEISKLEAEGYLTKDETLDANGDKIQGGVWFFVQDTVSYEFRENPPSGYSVINCY